MPADPGLSTTDRRRRYEIDRISRCAVTLYVEAATAQEALAIARAGGGESQGSPEYVLKGWTRPRLLDA